MTEIERMSHGTQGEWRVRMGDGFPLVVAYGLGRFHDEQRTVAIMKDNSILSHEDAELIVRAVNEFRAAKTEILVEALRKIRDDFIGNDVWDVASEALAKWEQT